MKRLSYLFIYVIFINTSCTKTTHDVRFHGRITLDCNNQIPIKNCKIYISREYDTGTHHSQSIGNTVTDNDGYYDLIADVKQKGSFLHYDYGFGVGDGKPASTYFQFGGSAQSYDNDKDIEMNCKAYSNKAYKFHIKNVSPFNSADVFNSLIVSHLNYYNYPLFELTNISNLTGINVDTTIYQFYFNQPKIDYKYSFTKNGVFTTIPPDTLSIPNCLDTITVNIFY